MEAKWELTREAERRGFVKTTASNRTRYEEIETFLELCLLRATSSPALLATRHTCPQTRVMHYSPQRHFCASSRELACLPYSRKMKFFFDNNSNDFTVQRGSDVKVLFDVRLMTKLYRSLKGSNVYSLYIFIKTK